MELNSKYNFTTRSKKAEKELYEIINSRDIIRTKLQNLRNNPRTQFNAHKLKGKLEGKWACYLGYDIRLVYEIDDENKEIVIVAAGSHKEAYT